MTTRLPMTGNRKMVLSSSKNSIMQNRMIAPYKLHDSLAGLSLRCFQKLSPRGTRIRGATLKYCLSGRDALSCDPA